MVAILNGVKMIEHGDNVLVANKNRKRGFEPQTIDVWKTLSSRGKVMVDAGSYTGFYAILASLSGASKVFAYEPNPIAIDRIKANLELNDVSNVSLRCSALSDKNGDASLYGKNSLTSAGSLVTIGKEIATVKTVRLDDENLGKVYAIKIDVERGEIALLRGAIETIKSSRPHILVEALDGPGEIDELLIPIGYESRTLDRCMYYYRIRNK